MKRLFAFAILATASVSFAQVPRIWLDANTSSYGVPLSHPELYNGLMVGTVLGPALGHPLPGQANMATQRVRVLDSRAFVSGAVVDVYLPTNGGSASETPVMGAPIDQTGAMPVGARVLIVAMTARNGVLQVPNVAEIVRADPAPVEPHRLTLGTSTMPSAFALSFFPTAQEHLHQETDPKWRFVGSVAEAIPGSDDANAVRVTDFLFTLQYPQRFVRGRPEDAFTKVVTNAVANDTAYHRALVDYQLNRLRYWGYADRFGRDLREAASDPNAFLAEIPFLSYFEQIGNDPDLPKEFKHDPPLAQSEILSVLARAKSPTIAAGLLHGLATKPSDADVRLLARFLDSPDAHPRWAMVERLCAWYGGTPPPRPTWDRMPDGTVHTEEVGLAEAVAAWKAKLATLVP